VLWKQTISFSGNSRCSWGKRFREKEIGRYGVFGTPALIINGKVKPVGRVPSRADLRKRLNNAKEG
jgi:hypothetical protein